MAMCYLDIKWNARGVSTICGHGNLHIAQMGKELLQIAESRVTCQLTVEEKECYGVLGLYYSVDVLYAHISIYLMTTAVPLVGVSYSYSQIWKYIPPSSKFSLK